MSKYVRVPSVLLLLAVALFWAGAARLPASEAASASPVTISAAFDSRVSSIPSVIAEQSPIALTITITARAPVPAKAQLVIKAREIFSGAQKVYRRNLARQLAAGETVTLPLILRPAELNLTPGSWLLIVDLKSGAKSLAGVDVGCVEVYARRKDESPEHAEASFSLAQVDYAWDDEYQIYYNGYAMSLPATGDPYDKRNQARMLKDFIENQEMAAELGHDGGMGFLYAATAYHALGEKDRQQYCEKVLRRTVKFLTETMYGGDGRIYSLSDRAHGRSLQRSSRTQDGFALQFLCQTYFYFRYGPGQDPEFAKSIVKVAGEINDYQYAYILDPVKTKQAADNKWGEALRARGKEPSPPRRRERIPEGPDHCRVYDGRCLAGMAWYTLVYRAETGEYPKNTDNIIDLASIYTQHLLSNKGWYDDGCLIEHYCHIWYGNINLLNGLLPAQYIGTLADTQDIASEHLRQGVVEAFRFLTTTNGAVTNTPAFVPSQAAMWSSGNAYEMCLEYLRRFGPDPGVERLAKFLNLTNLGPGYAFHRCNAYGGELLRSPEYLALENKPLFAWNVEFPKKSSEDKPAS